MEGFKEFVALVLFAPTIVFFFSIHILEWALYPYTLVVYLIINREFLAPCEYSDMIGRPFAN